MSRRNPRTGLRGRSSRTGFLLIMVLLISAILLVMGLGMLSVKSLQYQTSVLFNREALARCIAEAGMEDALFKLERDPRFPPQMTEEQTLFTYTEDFHDLDGATRLGSYTVTVDMTMRNSPYAVLRVSSFGVAGNPQTPVARQRITAEIDVSQTLRGDATIVNPHRFEYLNWHNEGGG